MDRIEVLKKKAIFQAARRAILENELFLREYVTNFLPVYTEQEMEDFNVMLEKIFDNDLFDIVMGNKKPSDFEGMYNQKFLTDISDYAEKKRSAIKANPDKRLL